MKSRRLKGPRAAIRVNAVSAINGMNGRQKTFEISHVYSVFYSGFTCQTTVIFGISWKMEVCIKYFSIMKLFHVQKPLSKWR